MARLNNGGWGISNMLTFLVIFVIFLLIVAVLIYNIDHEKDSDIQLVQEEVVLFS